MAISNKPPTLTLVLPGNTKVVVQRLLSHLWVKHYVGGSAGSSEGELPT